MSATQASQTVTSPSRTRFDVSTIAEALQRSAQLNVGFPTRTIRITEAELASRDNTPNPISIEDLVNRPRSNPRTRTPMRYESPLESGAFRRERLRESNNVDSNRISIRPMAGSAVGTVPRRINVGTHDRSVKQGPSQRKLRKWNNDHFAGLAAEIASSNGHAAADVLMKANRDAHLYRSVFDPKDRRRSAAVDRFMKGDDMKEIREQFFEGCGPSKKNVTPATRAAKTVLSGDDMLNRIDQRLRRLVIRACHNSYAAAKVVEFFESYIVGVFTNNTSIGLDNGWWTDLLLECPTFTHRKESNRYTAQFFFHPTHPTGGFHRLLLHAVCQFHGLNVVSRTEDSYEFVWENKVTTGTRALSATGPLAGVSKDILMLDFIGEATNDPIGYALIPNELMASACV